VYLEKSLMPAGLLNNPRMLILNGHHSPFLCLMYNAGSPKPLFDLVDLKPIHEILLIGLRLDGPGRPVVCDPEWRFEGL